MCVRLLALAALVGVVVAAGAAAAFRDAPSAPPGLPRGTATIATASGDVVVSVDRARTPAARARGLMHRESQAAGPGMG